MADKIKVSLTVTSIDNPDDVYLKLSKIIDESDIGKDINEIVEKSFNILE